MWHCSHGKKDRQMTHDSIFMLLHLEWGRCLRLCGPPGSWQQAGCLGPGAGDGRKGPGELRQTARLRPQPLRPAALKSHPERPAKMSLGWMRISNSCRKRHHPRDSPQYLKNRRRRLDWVSVHKHALCVCVGVRHTNMEGCTGGNGWRPQPECVCEKWWWEEEGDQQFASPPPPPGPSVAPPHWCWFPAGYWAKWSGSTAVC